MNAYEILTNNNRFAVLGMHEDHDKYAYKIFMKLLEKGKTVYGVNPKYQEIEGHKIYPSIEAIDAPIDVCVFVVNPKIGINMIDGVKAKGIQHLWLQPGTIDDALLEKADNLELDVVEACVLALYNIYEPNQ